MSSTKYRVILWSSVIGTLALVVVGMVWLAKGGGQPHLVIPGVNEIVADDHVTGNAAAAVTLVEYADFQCPGCGLIYPALVQLEKDYGDRVRFVYRNFPIPGHANGLPAAYAAGAAGAQGKFFEMAELLFAKQKEWSSLESGALVKVLDSYAQFIGLDQNKFLSDMGSDAVRAKVDKDAQSGVKAGVNETPSFFLNGKKITPSSYDEFKRELDGALSP